MIRTINTNIQDTNELKYCLLKTFFYNTDINWFIYFGKNDDHTLKIILSSAEEYNGIKNKYKDWSDKQIVNFIGSSIEYDYKNSPYVFALFGDIVESFIYELKHYGDKEKENKTLKINKEIENYLVEILDASMTSKTQRTAFVVAIKSVSNTLGIEPKVLEKHINEIYPQRIEEIRKSKEEKDTSTIDETIDDVKKVVFDGIKTIGNTMKNFYNHYIK